MKILIDHDLGEGRRVTAIFAPTVTSLQEALDNFFSSPMVVFGMEYHG